MSRQKRKKQFPFGRGTNPSLNAWRGGTNDFAAYGIGYFDAGNFLAKHIIETRDARGELILDVAIYPIVYLYRQGAELMLKHFMYDKPNAAPLRGNHNLEALWKQARPEIQTMLDQYGGPTEKKALKKLDKFISRLHIVDPNGEAFRFPEDLKRGKHLEEFVEINLQPIYESGKEAGEIFTWFADARTEIRAEEYEAMQEFESE